MTEISMRGDSDLAGVLLAADPPFDLYLTLRDSDGKVLWSQGVYQYSLDRCYPGDLTIRTESIQKKIEESVDAHRAALQVKFAQAGLL